jgi:hypothetical protein
VREVPAGITIGAGAGAGGGAFEFGALGFEFELELAGFEFEVEPVLSGEVPDMAEAPDGVVEWLQLPEISRRPAMKQRVTTRFSILPPFFLQGLIEGFVVSMKRYFDGLNDCLKSGWVNDVRIRYSSLGAQVNRELPTVSRKKTVFSGSSRRGSVPLRWQPCSPNLPR